MNTKNTPDNTSNVETIDPTVQTINRTFQTETPEESSEENGEEARERKNLLRQLKGVANCPGLFRNIHSGKYYYRFRLQKKRFIRYLRTSDYKTALLVYKEEASRIQKIRARADGLAGDIKTMGDLIEGERLDIESDTNLADVSRESALYILSRIEKAWPGIHSLKPGQVTLIRLREFKTKLFEEQDSAPSIVNKIMRKLSKMLKIAVKHYLLTSNPLEDKKIKEEMIGDDEYRIPNLPPIEKLYQIFEFIGKFTDIKEGFGEELVRDRTNRALNIREHAQFMFLTGVRVSEANRFQWEDIDFANNLLHINSLGSEPEVRVKPKNKPRGKTWGSDRSIPIFPWMATYIEEVKARRIKDGLPLTGDFLQIKESLVPIQRACTKLELPKMIQHDMRHYFATYCIQQGIDIYTISKWLGHSDGGKQCSKTYAHLLDGHSQEMAKKLTPLGSTAQSISA